MAELKTKKNKSIKSFLHFFLIFKLLKVVDWTDWTGGDTIISRTTLPLTLQALPEVLLFTTKCHMFSAPIGA